MHEVRGFVPVEANAVTGTVRKSGQSIPRSPTLALVVLAHRIVDGADGNVDFGGFQRNFLTAFDGIPYFSLPGVWLAEHPRSRYVGLISVHREAAIHENHRAFAYFLRLHR